MTSENIPQSDSNSKPATSGKSSSKRVFFMVILGSLICVTLTSFYTPRMIAWYFEPPMPMGVSCTASIAWALHKLQLVQLVSIGVGALLGLLVGLKIRRKNS